MLLGGPLVLMLFGPEFAAGAVPLAVLCLALVVRSALGPAALVLSIHDHPYASLPAIGLGLGTLVVANLLLVPRFGLMGAAVAALVAITALVAGAVVHRDEDRRASTSRSAPACAAGRRSRPTRKPGSSSSSLIS